MKFTTGTIRQLERRADTAERFDVRRWMHANAEWSCNEVQRTQLAEAAAERFDLYEDDADATIPQWVFDMAAEVGAVLEQQANMPDEIEEYDE